MRGSNLRPTDCQTVLQLTELRGKLTKLVQIKTSHFHCLFRKEVRHRIKVSHSPLSVWVYFSVTFESSPATDSPDQWPPLAGNLWTAGCFITCLVCWPTISPGFDWKKEERCKWCFVWSNKFCICYCVALNVFGLKWWKERNMYM